jgi:hypothetical protein
MRVGGAASEFEPVHHTVEVHHDLAYVMSDFTETLRPRDGGPAVHVEGRLGVFWRLSETGWLAKRDLSAFATLVDPEVQQGRFIKVEVVQETQRAWEPRFATTTRCWGCALRRDLYILRVRSRQAVQVGLRRWTGDAVLTGGPVSSNWIFEPADGGTDVTVRPWFKTRIPVLNHLARGIMMWSWRKALPKFMTKVEKRAKVGATA